MQDVLHLVEIELRVVFDVELVVAVDQHTVELGHVTVFEVDLIQIFHDADGGGDHLDGNAVLVHEDLVDRHVVERHTDFIGEAQFVPHVDSGVEEVAGVVVVTHDNAVVAETVVDNAGFTHIVRLLIDLELTLVVIIGDVEVAVADGKADMLFPHEQQQVVVFQLLGDIGAGDDMLAALAVIERIAVIGLVVAVAERDHVGKVVEILVLAREREEVVVDFIRDAERGHKIICLPASHHGLVAEQIRLEHQEAVAAAVGDALAFEDEVHCLVLAALVDIGETSQLVEIVFVVDLVEILVGDINAPHDLAHLDGVVVVAVEKERVAVDIVEDVALLGGNEHIARFQLLADDLEVHERLIEGEHIDHVVEHDEIDGKERLVRHKGDVTVIGDDHAVKFPVEHHVLVFDAPGEEIPHILDILVDLILFIEVGKDGEMLFCACMGELFKEFKQRFFAVLEVVKDHQERHDVGDGVEDLDDVGDELLMLEFRLIAHDGLDAAAGAAFVIGFEYVDVQRIDVAIRQERGVIDVGKIPLVKRADPVHQGGVTRLHHAGLEFVIERLNRVLVVVGGDEDVFIFNREGIAVFNEKQLAGFFVGVVHQRGN